MNKIYLSLGSVYMLYVPFQALAYESSAIKRNLLPPIYASGYHCTKEPTTGPMYYTGFGSSLISQDEANKAAKLDCENSPKNSRKAYYDWKSTSTYYLQGEQTNIGKWYCMIPGYHISSTSFFSSSTTYKGAIGYADTQEDAEAQMKSQFWLVNSGTNGNNIYFQDPSPYCDRVGMLDLVKMNSNITIPTIQLLTSPNSQNFMNGDITNLEDKGSDVRYTCMISNSIDGTYTKAPNDSSCIVMLQTGGAGNGFVVRPPLIGSTDKWVKIQAKRIPTMDGDGVNKDYAVYSNPVKISKVTPITYPPEPLLTLTYSDSKTITGVISNTGSPVTDYTYDCVYTTKQNAEKVSPVSTQFTPFKFNYPSLCTIDTNTKTFKIDLLNMPETLKGDYFAIRVYKNGQYEPVFSKAMPMLDTPCRTPISTDFGKIIPLTQQNYRLTIPFRSTRTLSTKPEAFGWNKQTADFTKQITVTPGIDPNSGKYAIIDLIDSTDGTDWYDYHIYNICENNVKSQSYCTIRIFNPSKYPSKDPLVCATEVQLSK